MRARLEQSQRTTRAGQSGVAFTDMIWVGSIGGAALATDPDPNVTPPAANRILRTGTKPGELTLMANGTIQIVFGVVAASSITVQVWFFDATQAKWIQFPTPPQTTTPTGGTATNTLFCNVAGLFGTRFFVQITANTLVQAMGYGAF